MIRQLPAAFALVIRGDCAPVIARLPQAWKNPAYRRARRLGQLPAEPAETAAYPAIRARNPASPTTCPPSGSPATAPPTPGADHDSNDPITAALQQLAAHHERLTQLDRPDHRHRRHPDRAQAALTKLDRAHPRPTPTLTLPPEPAPAWWKLAAADRQEPLARLRAWVRAGLPPRLRPPGRHPGPLLGAPTTCACTAWTSWPTCGPCSTSSPNAPRAAVGPGRVPGPHPARPGRPADDRDHHAAATPAPRRPGHPRSTP